MNLDDFVHEIVAHNDIASDHGINCACMDSLIRLFRVWFRNLPSSEQARLHWVLDRAMRTP